MRRSTDSLIALQFLAVVVPIAFVLLAQMIADARRAATLEHSRPLRTLANDARANFRTFTNGAADAVDTGTLGPKSAEALRSTAALLRRLAVRGESGVLGQTPGLVTQLAGEVSAGATLAQLLPLREKIVLADRQTQAIDEEFERRDAAAVSDAVESARRQKHEVAAALVVSFILTTVFALATRRRLKQQLEAEAATERQLRDASRQAGMAEVATSVLHNVGNVLNSVNVAANLAAESLKKSRADRLGQVASLLQEHRGGLASFFESDERGKALPVYLAEFVKHLGATHDKALKDLASLQSNIEHIKEIVAMQQRYSRLSVATETIDVTHLVEESLRINVSGFERNAITLVREFEPVPPITVDKHKVLQILVNLVRNAKDACEGPENKEKRVTIRVARCNNGVRITVADTGVGISSENMTRIFTHGFTTKKSGHGFGLHSGALTARELGGALRADSGGPGLGASFFLDLPVSPPEAAHA